MTPSPLLLPENFTLGLYRLTIEPVEKMKLPPLKGSALRGGFGITFKRLVCQSPAKCARQKRCVLGNACPYGYVFETSPPDNAAVLRNIQNIPRPFIIQSPRNRQEIFQPGERLSFGLVLTGNAMPYLPHFIAVFRELGFTGLGPWRSQYRLQQVDALYPYSGSKVTVFVEQSDILRVPDLIVTAETIHAHAAALPADRITLDFITPTRIKYRSKWLRQGPPFAALVQSLLGRISSLSYFHCGQAFEADFRGLIDRAGGVKIVKSETRWQDWSRRSSRQKRYIKMGGLVGQVTYAGDLRAYLPILALGELIHVGKGTVFGNGQYSIVRQTPGNE